MAEMTGLSAIRDKLREFDDLMTGAVDAALELSTAKEKATQVVAELNRNLTEFHAALTEVEKSRAQLTSVATEWHSLRDQISSSQKELLQCRDETREHASNAVATINERLADAETRLNNSTQTQLQQQAALLRDIDERTRTNAEAAKESKDVVVKNKEEIARLVESAHQDLREEAVRIWRDYEERFRGQFVAAQSDLQDKQEKDITRLFGEMSSFREDLQSNLGQHNESIDRKVTDFLNKQNALIQNLTQHVDAYHRSAAALSEEMKVTRRELLDLKSSLNDSKQESQTEIRAAISQIRDLRQTVSGLQSSLTLEGESRVTVESAVESLTIRLNEVIQKLQQSFFVGKRFK